MGLKHKYYFFYWEHAQEYVIKDMRDNGKNMTEYHEWCDILYITDHFSYETFALGRIIARANTLEELMPIVFKTMGENAENFILKFKGENYENI